MTGRPFNRRKFLKLASVGGGTLLVVGLLKGTSLVYGSTPLGTRLVWLTRMLDRRLLGEPSLVGLSQCASYADAPACLRLLWQQAGLPEVQGQRVLVKPNMIEAVEGRPSTTSPELVAALVRYLAEQGARDIVVGDGSGFRRDLTTEARACGLAQALKGQPARLVDLNYDDPRPVVAPAGWFIGTNQLWLPRSVREADLIVSVPRLKTHHWAGVSLSLKNLFGLVPGCRYGWPKNMLHFNGISRSIIGLYEASRSLAPLVTIVDGIVGMEGDGPINGEAVDHGLLAAGRDLVAVDTVCTQLMGFNPQHIEHLLAAMWTGAGQVERIRTVGEPRERLQRHYQAPPGAKLVG